MERAAVDLPFHSIHVELVGGVPTEVEAGALVPLKVAASCEAGCDLGGCSVAIIGAEGVVAKSVLASDREGGETEHFGFQAPLEVGNHAWTVLVAKYETPVGLHNQVIVPVNFATRPHPTSMSAWDVPSPVVVNTLFNLKVGVKCSSVCRLTDAVVEVCDEAGAKVGEAPLGRAAWPGTDGLFWTAVHVRAPSTEQVASWSARFPGDRLSLPHDAASVAFSFRVERPPQHRAHIRVVARDTATPVSDVEIRVGPYEVFSDEGGGATVVVPRGRYLLQIRKDGYKARPIHVEVNGDVAVTVEASKVPTHAELEDMMRRFEGEYWR